MKPITLTTMSNYSVNIREGAHPDAPGEWVWLVTVYGPDGGIIEDTFRYSKDDAKERATEAIEEDGGNADDADEDD